MECNGNGNAIFKIGGMGRGMRIDFENLGNGIVIWETWRNGNGNRNENKLCQGNGEVMGMRISRFFATLGGDNVV